MKKYFNAFMMFCLLNLGIWTKKMQETDGDLESVDKEHSCLELDTSENLPNEIWAIILGFVYFDQHIVDESQNIHEALADVRVKLFLASKSLRLVCKRLNFMNENFYSLKNELRLFYQNVLKNRFLEHRNGGYFPKNGEWGINNEIDLEIAQFIEARAKIVDNPIIARLVQSLGGKNKEDAINKLIDLVLFYDANINSQTNGNDTALHLAIFLGSNSDVSFKNLIAMLLAYHADVNIQNLCRYTALELAIPLSNMIRDGKDIVAMLVAHDANFNIPHEDRTNFFSSQQIVTLELSLLTLFLIYLLFI